MLKALFSVGMSPLYKASLFHIFAIVFVLAEAFTDSVIDSFIYIVLYPAYGDISETSVPYLIACLLPTKPVRRFIIIIYIPVICLWCAGRKAQRRQHSSCGNFEPLVKGDCDPLALLPSNQSQRKPVCAYRPKRFLWRIERRLEKGWDCCCQQYAWPCLCIARQQILSAVWYCRRFWNFCCSVLVTVPIIVCRNGRRWVRGQQVVVEVDNEQLKGRSRSWKEFLKQARSGTLLPRSRSLSWGELVHLNDERYQAVLKSYSKRLMFYRLLPLKTASRLWGRFNQLLLPVWLRSPAFRLYIWMFGCCLDDALVQDLTKYRNLSEFFQRCLRPGIRPIDGSHSLVSPVDGTVLYFGTVQKDALEQVKGVTYSMKGFLGPMDELLSSCINIATTKTKPVKFSIDGDLETEVSLDNVLCTLGVDDLSYHQNLLTNASNQLYQCLIYLAPGDYHRFHSPADWTVYGRRHFPGELFSVNPGFARWLQGLFNFNERALYVGRWQHGFFSMAAVGATNVGSISVCFDKSLSTNAQSAWETGCFFDAVFLSKQRNGVKLRRGDDFGAFNLGSTVVLLFEAPPTFEFQIEIGQKLKYGQGIGDFSKKMPANRCKERA